jgi:hypothetical protein
MTAGDYAEVRCCLYLESGPRSSRPRSPALPTAEGV